MTAYHEYFIPIFSAGFLVATATALIAGMRSGIVLPMILLIVGVLSFWAALFFGSELGYRHWQSIPNPPPEAYSDTAPMGALLLGWLPGGIYCFGVFGCIRLFRWILLRRGNQAEIVSAIIVPVETGNPFQGPQSGEGESN